MPAVGPGVSPAVDELGFPVGWTCLVVDLSHLVNCEQWWSMSGM